MKRTRTRDTADIFANVTTIILWLIHKLITVIVPILFMTWLALSMVEVVINLDHTIAGIPYEYHELNFFFIIKNWLSK